MGIYLFLSLATFKDILTVFADWTLEKYIGHHFLKVHSGHRSVTSGCRRRITAFFRRAPLGAGKERSLDVHLENLEGTYFLRVWSLNTHIRVMWGKGVEGQGGQGNASSRLLPGITEFKFVAVGFGNSAG